MEGGTPSGRGEPSDAPPRDAGSPHAANGPSTGSTDTTAAGSAPPLPPAGSGSGGANTGSVRVPGRVGHRRARYLSVAVVVGAAAGAAVALAGLRAFGVLVGWDVAAVVYMSLLWARLWPLDGPTLAARARHTDPTRIATDLLLLAAALASLVAVGFALANAGAVGGWLELAHVGLGLLSVVVSWAVIHTVFALRYAHIYYHAPVGGVSFPTDHDTPPDTPPRFSDFAYLAFTIGMTFQVSDTTLTSATMRRVALRHGLLSFLFGTGILATTINLVASLTSSK